VEELLLIKEVAARIRTAGERLRVTAALHESEARFRIITKAMPQMVWSNRPDGYNRHRQPEARRANPARSQRPQGRIPGHAGA